MNKLNAYHLIQFNTKGNTWYKNDACICGISHYYHFILQIHIVGGGVQNGSTRHVGHFWPIVPAPGDCKDGELGGIKIGRGNRSTRRKSAPTPLCPTYIPLDKTRARIGAAAVGNQRLTPWAMARPYIITISQPTKNLEFNAHSIKIICPLIYWAFPWGTVLVSYIDVLK
jgi:hypothetical protein